MWPSFGTRAVESPGLWGPCERSSIPMSCMCASSPACPAGTSGASRSRRPSASGLCEHERMTAARTHYASVVGRPRRRISWVRYTLTASLVLAAAFGCAEATPSCEEARQWLHDIDAQIAAGLPVSDIAVNRGLSPWMPREVEGQLSEQQAEHLRTSLLEVVETQC